MLVPGDLGFRVAALFIFIVFPATFFVLRRKWRIAAARSEEISRLLVLASEEAARTEIEASVGYSYTSFTPSQQRRCAVCFIPTNNRCARCKSVNYCSGKCQIIHWRQGHKDECHPPLVDYENSEGANVFLENSVKQPCSDNQIANTENDTLHLEKDGFSCIPLSPIECSVKDDNAVVVDSADVKELGSLSEVDEFTSGDGICIDDSTDDDTLHHLDSKLTDSCSTVDSHETLSDKNVVPNITPGEESYTDAEAGRNTSGSGAPAKAHAVNRNDVSDLKIGSDNDSTEPAALTSDFWDGSLDFSRTKKYVHTNNFKTKIGRVEEQEILDSVQSFNLSGNLSPEFPVQDSEVSHGTYRESSRVLVEHTLTDNSTSRQSISTILSPQKPALVVQNIKIDEKLTEVRPVDRNLEDSGLPSCSLNVANSLERDNKDTSSTLSKKDSLSPKTRTELPSYSAKRCAARTAKSIKPSYESAMSSSVTTSPSSAAVGLKTSMLKVVEQLKAPRLSKHSDAVARNSEKVIFPYDLFLKLYHWNKLELRPSGLINCGNSCYANVVLQCLAFTPPLTAYLLQGLHSKTCVKKEWCFTCEFEALILKAKGGSSPLSPIGILSQIQRIGSHLASGREEDAHEFLRYAIDTMQSACLQENGAGATGSSEEETTLMGLTFGGYLRSKIKCTRCRGKSERQERMMDLTVEIEGDIETLEDALRQFTATESLDGENKYHCCRCKSYEKAKKKLSIVEAPNVLTIALKRFQSGKFGKLNKSIRFPEILNLAPYMRGGNDKSPIYRLFGVVVHLDIMNASFSGHYVCYVRNAHNKWYKIDDSVVQAVESERVLNKGAYMLFYSRCSPRAPRSIRSSVIPHDLPTKMKNPEIDPPQSTGNKTTKPKPGFVHQGETKAAPNILEFDSSSDCSSVLSNSDEVSSNTDSTRDSISADDISDYYIFGHNGMWRHSSDSDTSSSSSSSSSPLYTKHSSLSGQERYVSTQSKSRQTFRTEERGRGVGVQFLQANSSSKQVRNVVNSGSCRGADTEKFGWTNSLDNMDSGVHLRRSLSKKADEAFLHTVLS